MGQNNDTKITYGLLGRNISYSLSPVMHNAAFRHFGIPAEYKLFDIEEDKLEDFLRDKILSGAISGFNVTVPYKMKIKEMLEGCSLLKMEIDNWVKIANAVNTVKVDGNTVKLWNTDMLGFFDSLEDDLGYVTRGRSQKNSCFIVGAGGAGRAIALFLKGMITPLEVYAYDIDTNKLSALEKDFKNSFQPAKQANIHIVDSRDALLREIKNCDLLVNATPLGTKKGDAMPVPPECLRKDLSVYDLVYARETELVKEAKARGAKAVNGLGMLVGQGARSFNIWTAKDKQETAEVMREALKEKEYGAG